MTEDNHQLPPKEVPVLRLRWCNCQGRLHKSFEEFQEKVHKARAGMSVKSKYSMQSKTPCLEAEKHHLRYRQEGADSLTPRKDMSLLTQGTMVCSQWAPS